MRWVGLEYLWMGRLKQRNATVLSRAAHGPGKRLSDQPRCCSSLFREPAPGGHLASRRDWDPGVRGLPLWTARHSAQPVYPGSVPGGHGHLHLWGLEQRRRGPHTGRAHRARWGWPVTWWPEAGQGRGNYVVTVSPKTIWRWGNHVGLLCYHLLCSLGSIPAPVASSPSSIWGSGWVGPPFPAFGSPCSPWITGEQLPRVLGEKSPNTLTVGSDSFGGEGLWGPLPLENPYLRGETG